MTDIPASARANAIPLEVKKDGLSQKQNGDWILRVVVAAVDMDGRITKAPMGTRYQCALVEIGDDETPKDHKAQDRERWRELGATRQAGIRCNDPVFWAFLEEELHFANVSNEIRAAEAVREHCGVASRSDFGRPGCHNERERWHKLDYAFQAWRIRENG